MRKYEEKVTLVKKRVKVVIECDLCRANRNHWAQNPWEIGQTEVSMRIGELDPGGDFGEDTTVDLCPKCFTEKLLPWLKTQGVKPRTEKWEEPNTPSLEDRD
jgi:hypothetical protein